MADDRLNGRPSPAGGRQRSVVRLIRCWWPLSVMALWTATSSGGTGDDAIHIEADTVGEGFTLGQSITQWGVVLTQTGGVSAAPGEKVEVTSNGILVPGNPASSSATTRSS